MINPAPEPASEIDRKLPLKDEKANNPIELLTFSMNDQFYSVSIMSVREIRGWSEPTALPHAPDFLRGVVNLRGTVLPIIDLAARIGGAPLRSSQRNVIVVIEITDQIGGLLVDAVSDILTVDKSSLQPPPEMAEASGDRLIGSLIINEDIMIRNLEPAELFNFSTYVD